MSVIIYTSRPVIEINSNSLTLVPLTSKVAVQAESSLSPQLVSTVLVPSAILTVPDRLLATQAILKPLIFPSEVVVGCVIVKLSISTCPGLNPVLLYNANLAVPVGAVELYVRLVPAAFILKVPSTVSILFNHTPSNPVEPDKATVINSE